MSLTKPEQATRILVGHVLYCDPEAAKKIHEICVEREKVIKILRFKQEASKR